MHLAAGLEGDGAIAVKFQLIRPSFRVVGQPISPKEEHRLDKAGLRAGTQKRLPLHRFPPLAPARYAAPHALFVAQPVEDPRHVVEGQTGGVRKDSGLRGVPRRLERE